VEAITFTTAAAATLRQRLSGILGTTAQALTVTTFHALGLRLIKQWSSELGFGDHLLAVYGREDARAVLREAATRLGLQLAPDVRQGDADPWALSLPKLDLAVERFRLGGQTFNLGESWQGTIPGCLTCCHTVQRDQFIRAAHGAPFLPTPEGGGLLAQS